jgi:hypothetical protein
MKLAELNQRGSKNNNEVVEKKDDKFATIIVFRDRNGGRTGVSRP